MSKEPCPNPNGSLQSHDGTFSLPILKNYIYTGISSSFAMGKYSNLAFICICVRTMQFDLENLRKIQWTILDPFSTGVFSNHVDRSELFQMKPIMQTLQWARVYYFMEYGVFIILVSFCNKSSMANGAHMTIS